MVKACANWTKRSSFSWGEYLPNVSIAWCTSFISTSYPLREHFPWKAVHVKTAFFQDFNARIAVHDAPIEFNFEGLRLPWLQGVHDVLRGLLALILECHSVCANFQGVV